MTQSSGTTPEQLEAFANQMDAMGLPGSQEYRDRAAVLRSAAKAQQQVSTPAQDNDVYLEGVDIVAFSKGWGTEWRRPTEPYKCPGETAGVMRPDRTNEPQIWLKFHSTDGNDYLDFIAIAYQTMAAGKLRSILDAIGIPYRLNGANISFTFPDGYPCTLSFQKQKDGRYKDQVRLVDALSPQVEAV